MSNISISRKTDTEHSNTTIKEIIRSFANIKKELNIDLEYELGIIYKISSNLSIKKILTAHKTGITFTGLNNSDKRQGLKAEVGYFVEDIYDEPTNNKNEEIFNYKKNIEEQNSYDIFISTIEREDTDNNGNYIIEEEDYQPIYKAKIYKY